MVPEEKTVSPICVSQMMCYCSPSRRANATGFQEKYRESRIDEPPDMSKRPMDVIGRLNQMKLTH